MSGKTAYKKEKILQLAGANSHKKVIHNKAGL
jgi:hypothetical protein